MRSSWTRLVFALLLVSFGCADGADPFAAMTDRAHASASVDVDAAPAPKLLYGFFSSPQGNGLPCLPSEIVLPENAQLQSAQWIGADGGELAIHGLDEQDRPVAHILAVPAGVVDEPTLFCMRLTPTNHMKVDLTAYALDEQGGSVNVGARGFDSPVYLYMAFANANVPQADAPRVTIVYEPDDGRPVEPTRGSSLGNRYAYGELWHFSKYALALD